MKRKDHIYFIISLVIMIIGVILTSSTFIIEFGFWGLLGRPSIEETKLVFTQHLELIIPGIILTIIGYVMVLIKKYK